MTLLALAAEYRSSCELLRIRIAQLRRELRECQDREAQLLLQDRLRHLRPMYRDCRAIARYLEHYYDRREGAYGAGPHQSAHLSAQQ